MIEVGDRVTTSNEVGVVCHMDPCVMRLESFHSYVIFETDRVTLLEKAADPAASLRPDILKRIQKFIDGRKDPSPTPTGGEGGGD